MPSNPNSFGIKYARTPHLMQWVLKTSNTYEIKLEKWTHFQNFEHPPAMTIVNHTP